ncbi:MAG TPA: FlgD immunoglobulin-like domain containing protein [Clostridia bacterium]|nr:FlgD immunoglobulin-like domain containing protein [Clostridia bacterium]
MRKTVAALVLTMVAALGIHVPSVSAAPVSSAKIVIIVGPTGSQTSSFRSSANSIYEEAIKWSSNVRKVYSPNATWSKVKSAITGANVVVYLGHGNGFPSKYSTTPRPTSQNGFGLNDSSLSDYKHVYYGESYIDDVQLAPNAIVLLNRLCYASGAGEPGDPNPTVSVARARVDNFAAGFIRAGARAVIADGHRSVASYITKLFSTSQTIDQLWRTTNAYGHIRTFASSRSSGFTGYTDPKYTDRDYYRSMVAKPNVTTRQITGLVGDTGLDPSTFAIPGRASVKPDGAALLDGTGAPAGTLAPETRLKVVARPTWTAPDGQPVLEVATLDDETISGFVRDSQLVPRDSVAPYALSVDALPGVISPNADGQYDTTELSASFSETVDWTLTVRSPGGTVVHEARGTGKEPATTWDGLRNNAPVVEGTYTYTFSGQDSWLNAAVPVERSGTVRVDTTGPVLATVSALADTTPWFSPNGDGSRDTFAIKGDLSESGRILAHVRNESGDVVRYFSTAVSAGSVSVAWDGRLNDHTVAPDGTYTVRLTPIDGVANAGEPVSSSVDVINLLGGVVAATPLVYPHDRDALATRSSLRFALTRPARVTWTIRDANGDVVLTWFEGAELSAGLYSRWFDGRRPDGTFLPLGKYTSHVTATDGQWAVAQATQVEANAFSITPSATSATRGRSITITAVTAEALSAAPKLYVYQPGISTWSASMSRVSAGKYRVTVTLRSSSSGTVTFRVRATDSAGGINWTQVKLPLR